MFDVYCPRHRDWVLLGARSIEHLGWSGAGIELQWRCHCGEQGTLRLDAHDDVAVAA